MNSKPFIALEITSDLDQKICVYRILEPFLMWHLQDEGKEVVLRNICKSQIFTL